MDNPLKSAYVGFITLKSNVRYWLRHAFKTFTLKGIRLSISNDRLLSKNALLAIFQGGYEDKENKLIKEKLSQEDIVLELGAGVGFNSITAAKINGAKIVSYEANPDLLPLIRYNQQLNRISFEIRNKILLTEVTSDSLTPFNIGVNFNTSSTKDYEGADHLVIETKQIRAEYLPDILKEISPTFLMIDIEGGEIDLFNKPDIFRKSSVKKILIDLHPWVIGDDGCNKVITNILDAGFCIDIESCYNSIFYFYR